MGEKREPLKILLFSLFSSLQLGEPQSDQIVSFPVNLEELGSYLLGIEGSSLSKMRRVLAI